MGIIARMPKAFAVWFKDLHRWDYSFFRTVAWQWPRSLLIPVGTVLTRRRMEVSPDFEKATLPIIQKISFGGKISLTDIEARKDYKGRLFWAQAGDLIYSKIRVKQGSLAIVPAELDALAVSTEYPVYSVNAERIDSAYLALVLKSRPFLSLFEGRSHGGSTKTRIPPSEFERQIVPLPPLAEQKAIVARWRKAHEEVTAARDRVEKRKATIDARFLADLGLRPPEQVASPKAFAVPWEAFLRWGVNFNRLNQSIAGLMEAKYSVVPLDCVLEFVQYGTSEKANSNSRGVAVIRMNNIVAGELDLSNLKHIQLSSTETEKLLLKEGDILFNRTNSKELVGKCAVFHAEGDYIFASYLIRVRPDFKKADPHFLACLINSSVGRQQIDALSRQIIGQANINSRELRGLRIPLPPLLVQKHIMERVAAGRLEIARELEAAERIESNINADIEALILGIKKL